MKKLLGVSIAAMLAVTPMMAHAAVDNNGLEALPMQGLNAQNQLEANTNIATTSYVQGAYNTVATQVNTVQTAINVDKTEAKNLSNGTIGANVEELDTAMGNVSTLGTNAPEGSVLATQANTTDLVTAVKAINQALNTDNGDSKVSSGKHYVLTTNSVGQNLDALDDAIGQVDNNGSKNYIATIGTDSTNGQKTVAENVQVLDSIVGQTTAGTHIKAIGTGSNQATVAANLKTLDTQVTAAEANITRLDGDANTTNSVLYKVYNNAELGKFTGTNTSLASKTNLQDAIIEVNRKADATNTAATVASNGSYVKVANSVATNLTNLDVATKANSQAIGDILAANIPVYGEWNNTNSTANVSISSLRGANPHAPASDVANPVESGTGTGD